MVKFKIFLHWPSRICVDEHPDKFTPELTYERQKLLLGQPQLNNM